MRCLFFPCFTLYCAPNEAYKKEDEENYVSFKAGCRRADLAVVRTASHAEQTKNFCTDKGAHNVVILSQRADETNVNAHNIFINPGTNKENQRYNIYQNAAQHYIFAVGHRDFAHFVPHRHKQSAEHDAKH